MITLTQVQDRRLNEFLGGPEEPESELTRDDNGSPRYKGRFITEKEFNRRKQMERVGL